MSGFVYFIICHDRIKIGFSLDPKSRLTKINADAPYRCELLGYVSADDFPEAELHELFADYRVHSEWFLAVPRITDFIENVSAARVAVVPEPVVLAREPSVPNRRGDPAAGIIARFGGHEAVQRITGASRSRVYRWTQPKQAGGTGGTIPTQHAMKLLAHARATGVSVTADDFLPARASAA